MNKQIFKSTSIGLVNKAIASIASFILLPLLLNILGTETYGIWMTILSTVGVFGFLDMGISYSLINFISANNDSTTIAKYIKTAYYIQGYFIGSIVVVFSLGFFLSTGVRFSIFLFLPTI